MKIKDRSRKRSHKLDGIGFGRIRTFPFSSNSVAYDPVKTRLSESEADAEEPTNHNAWNWEHCDWFILSLLLPTPTMQFSPDHKRLSHPGISAIGVLLPTPTIWFSLDHIALRFWLRLRLRRILVTRALDRPKALGNSMQENMRRRVLIAKNRLLEPYGACSLLVLAWMYQLETLLIVLHENQWEDTLFQGSPELFSRSVKRRALGSRLTPSIVKTSLKACTVPVTVEDHCFKFLRMRTRGGSP